MRSLPGLRAGAHRARSPSVSTRANQHAGVEYLNLSRLKVDPRVLTLLPQPLVNEHHVVPIAFCNNRLTLAMTNPNNIVAFDDVRRIVKGVMIEPAVVTEDDFKRFMTHDLRAGGREAGRRAPAAKPRAAAPPARRARSSAAATTVDLLQSDIIRELQLAADADVADAETKQDLMSASEDAPIIRLANSILGLAIKQGAATSTSSRWSRRSRSASASTASLQVVQRLPKKVQLGLISRLKILSKLDISEKRLPQDGRISVTMEGKPIDFRVSTVPGKWGEKVVHAHPRQEQHAPSGSTS